MLTSMTETIALFGATGTIGRATAQALRQSGYRVIAPVRGGAVVPGCITMPMDMDALPDVLKQVDGVICCLASRTGTPKDSWAVDSQLTQTVITAAAKARVARFVLLSAICVQKPLLDFQKAKLASEAALQATDMTWSIVRSTAYFKSLSGQLDRVQNGKPFLVFGDGTLTACKPISDRDLGDFLVSCLSDPARQNAVLPIGGPGPAITPMDQVDILADLLGERPKVKHVPPRFLAFIAKALGGLGIVIPRLREKAALARIGHYYATESMLVWKDGRYDADATPSFGQDHLADHYRALIQDKAENERGSHAVF